MIDSDTEKLKEIFRVVFDLPVDADVVGLRRITLRKWDSLAHVSLVAAIESEFGLRLDAADAERMSSFAGTQLLLGERGV